MTLKVCQSDRRPCSGCVYGENKNPGRNDTVKSFSVFVPAGVHVSPMKASTLSQDFGVRVKLLSLLRRLQLSSASRKPYIHLRCGFCFNPTCDPLQGRAIFLKVKSVILFTGGALCGSKGSLPVVADDRATCHASENFFSPSVIVVGYNTLCLLHV